MVYSGAPFVHVVTFAVGFPDGDVVWTLTDAAGATVATGSVTPAAQALSVTITVAGAHNTLGAGALFAPRFLYWTYLVAGANVTDGLSYTVEKMVPLGASRDGVRRKLGLEPHEVPDADIDLLRGYSDLAAEFDLTDAEADTGRLALVARDAVEAQTALNLLGTLQVRLAAKEVGGEKQFQRGDIDYVALSQHLDGYLMALRVALDPSFDPLPAGGLFTLAGRTTDPITGA